MKKLPWAKFKAIINNFHNEANQIDVIWKRHNNGVHRFGEDLDGDVFKTEDIVLKALIQFNDFRTWPITKFTLTGNEDKQSEVLILNIQYLKSLNLLDEHGKFNYNPNKDRFIHLGIEYEDAGNTPVAQASDENLLFYIVLKRTNG